MNIINQETRLEPVDTLKPHPRNPRRGDVGAIEKSIEANGFYGVVIAQLATGHILAGNHRWQAAKKAGAAEIPVVWVDVDDATALRILLADNKTNDVATYDFDELAAVLQDVFDDAGTLEGTGFSPDDLIQLLGGDDDVQLLEPGEEVGEESPDRGDTSPRETPDALFPTDAEWGVPMLDLRMQATGVTAPFTPWGAKGRTQRLTGTLHFYTEDYRYTALWRDPSPVVLSGVPTLVEPNFSCYKETPRAVALYRTYQKRWLARYWQSKGIRVLADLNVNREHADLNLIGIPKGWRAWATRGYADRIEDTIAEFAIAKTHAGTDDILFVVVGGGKAVKAAAAQYGWTWIAEDMDTAKAKTKTKRENDG